MKEAFLFEKKKLDEWMQYCLKYSKEMFTKFSLMVIVYHVLSIYTYHYDNLTELFNHLKNLSYHYEWKIFII